MKKRTRAIRKAITAAVRAVRTEERARAQADADRYIENDRADTLEVLQSLRRVIAYRSAMPNGWTPSAVQVLDMLEAELADPTNGIPF